MTQNSHHHRPLMVQAPVRALDPDGMTVVTAGTIAFAIGAGVCWWLLPQLEAAGKGWYLGVSITGFALGMFGLGFGLFRKQRRRSGGLADELATDLDADGAAPRRAMDAAPPAEPLVEKAHVDADGVPDREG